MAHGRVRIAACLGMLGALCPRGPAGAQRLLVEPPDHVLHQWTTADGLPQNSVNAIAEAPDGRLWLGTYGGLVSFDGTSFEVLARTDSGGRHIDRVLALAIGPDSALWVGTEDGLRRVVRGAYATVALPAGFPDAVVRALHVDTAGRLWVGTQGGGLAVRDGDAWREVRTPGDAPMGPVGSFARGRDGGLLLNLGDHVFSPDPADPARVRRHPVPGTGLASARGTDARGAEWYAVPGAALRVESRGARRLGPPDGVSEPNVMVADPEGGVWLGTLNEGLFRFDEGPGRPRAQRYALPSGAERFRVLSGLVTSDGSAWFGTNAGGLLRATRQLFTTYTEAHGLSHSVITAVLEDAAGTMWVATNCGGLTAIAPDGRVRVHKPRLANDPRGDPCVFSLAESPAGTLWVGTYGGGLTRIRDGREEWVRLLPGMRDSVVLALHGARDGTLWVGTNSGGLSLVRDGRVVRTITTADGLAHNGVRHIREGREGTVWVGTLGGLTRIREGALRSFGAADGLRTTHVRAIHEDAEGILWVGTYGGGLHRLTDSGFVAVTTAEGLREDVVSSILEDDAGFFWMSGNAGVQRVARAELLASTDGRRPRVHAVLFGAEDGMRNAETNGGFQPAGWRDRRGRLWFPTVQGVARVDPARLTRAAATPPTAITEVVVDGVVRASEGALRLGPGRPNLELRYSGLSLSGAEHLAYRYRLSGFDDAWVEAGSRRVAYFPRLAPGAYRFEVMAANRDGTWHREPTGLDLQVLAPFTARTGFRVAAALMLTLLLALLIRARTLRTRERHAAQVAFGRRLIERQEQERTRIARELHDGLGQELLVAKNRALLALQDGALPGRARTQLEALSASLSDTLDGLRAIAHALTPHQLEHLGLEPALRAMVEATAAASGIPMTIRSEGAPTALSREASLNLYRAVQEALANVVRHSHASAVEVRLQRLPEMLRVLVSDDGRGFEVERDGDGGVQGGFGLAGIRERLRLVGGRSDVVSAPGRGTLLILEVPTR